MRLRSLDVAGDDDPLARGEAIVLDDVRSAEGVERLVDLVRGRADVRACGGNPRARHDVLREGLGALDLRGLLGGAEHRDARLAHGVGDPGDEGRLRAHDDEIGAELRGQRGHGLAVQRVDLVQLGDLGDAGVAGGAVQGGDAGVEGQGAAQGMFAGAVTDDEDLHGVSLTGAGLGGLCGLPRTRRAARCTFLRIRPG